jgi:hypothetical protein
VYQGAVEARGGGSALRQALVGALTQALDQALPEDVRIDPGQLRSVRDGDTTIWLCTLVVGRRGREEMSAGAAIEGASREEAVLAAALDAAVRATEGLELREPPAPERGDGDAGSAGQGAFAADDEEER